MSTQQSDAPADCEAEGKTNANNGSLSVSDVLAIMEPAQTVAISGHVNPDGDALGSALALRDLLEAMGKEVTVLLGQDSPPPALYEFLPNYHFVQASEYDETPDLYIVVDASTAKRLGTAEKLIERAGDTLVIDHHARCESFAQHYYSNTTAPATATLIWEIIKASALEPTLNMATYCYVAIMTDTGRFAFRNTDRSAFIDATEMVDIGVNPAEISKLVYENKTVQIMRLEALIIDRLQFAFDNRVVYTYLLLDDLTMLGLKRDDTEQIPTILRSIKGVEVAILFRDEGGEGVRVNLRSRGNYSVGNFAYALGGGGHAGAAGLTLALPLEESISTILDNLVKDPDFC
ncbi:MAG: bifunctional oligoribonuclease/PAP phosphatase NrnA [Coriobacteriales bacterium]|jgi:phosphoesterase RecJ-like protein|nr:bifunctional oligoribonuclease/PAP phosphatase NrnA [Coriobacteriales bacterium]